MDTQAFISKVTRCCAEQVITVKFHQLGGILGLMRLFGLTKSNTDIRFDNEVLVGAILASQDWGHDSNRSVVVIGFSQSDRGMLYEISRDVESVTQPEHPAKAIASKREKSRLQAAKDLEDAILADSSVEAEEWGLEINFAVIDDDGFNVARFSITDGQTEHASVGVDAWSGRLQVDGILTDEIYTDPEQLRTLLSKSILEAAEKATV